MPGLYDEIKNTKDDLEDKGRNGLNMYQNAKSNDLDSFGARDNSGTNFSDNAFNNFRRHSAEEMGLSDAKNAGSMMGSSEAMSLGTGTAGAAAGATEGIAATGGAEAAATAAGAAAGPAGIAVAVAGAASSDTVKKTVKWTAIGCSGLFFLLLAALVALPILVWNLLFHMDDLINPPLDMKDEIQLNDANLRTQEEEWAEIIDKEMEKGYNTVLQGVRRNIRARGLDVDRSMANLITPGHKWLDEGATSSSVGGGSSGGSSGIVGTINASLQDAASSKSNLVKYAMSYAVPMGQTAKVPYKQLGSQTPEEGMDCVGFVCFVYKNFGINLNYGNVQNLYNNITGGNISGDIIVSDLAGYNASEVSKLKEGDILIFGTKDGYEGAPRFNHTGIYAGNGYILHSSTRSGPEGTTNGVIYEKLFQDNGDFYWGGTYLYRAVRIADEDSLGEKTAEDEVATNEALKSVNAVNDYEPQIYAFLRQMGYSHETTCAFLGNMMKESNCDPTCVEGGYLYSASERANITRNLDSYCRNYLFPVYDREGISINKGAYMYNGKYYPGAGLIQWTGERASKLESFASSQGGVWSDLNIQLSFMEKELTSGSYSQVSSDTFKKSTDVRSATEKVMHVYEGNYNSTLEERIAYAIDASNRYNGVDVSSLSKYRVSNSYGMILSSRALAEIISAFSIYEDQYIGTFEQVEQDIDDLDQIANTDNKFLRYARMGKYILKKGFQALVQQFRNPEEDLKKLVKKHAAELYEVKYGSIASYTYKDDEDEEHTVRYYTSITIEPLTSEKIIKKLFEIEFDDPYVTKDDIQMGAKDTTMGEAIKSMADGHMEMLYNNHDVGNSARYGLMGDLGEAAIGNPIGTGSFDSSLITSYFGYRTLASTNGVGTTNHGGIDIGVPSNTPIYAAKAGTITRASWYGGYGNCVDIKHDDGTMTRYGHLASFSVSQGARVSAGQQVALSDSTGNSTGPHLHFEYYIAGEKVDPLLYLLKGSELERYIS